MKLHANIISTVISMMMFIVLLGSSSFDSAKTEHYLQKNYTHKNGTFNSYPVTSKQPKEALSESIGLFMYYLVLKKDRTTFQKQVNVLQSVYLQKNNFIYWRYNQYGKPKGTANALIDDLRIIQALRDGGKIFNNASYIQLANDIQNFIVREQSYRGTLVDFTDAKGLYPAHFLTTSYPDPVTVVTFPEPLRTNTLRVIKNIPNKTFYPLTYDVQTRQYHMQTEVNMIDQSLIALNRQRVGADSTPFWNFIKNEMKKQNKVFGRYDATTKKRTVTYESTSIYAILTILAVERKDLKFAQTMYNRMNAFRDQTTGSFAKGYEAHFFDQSYGLVAEQVLKRALKK